MRYLFFLLVAIVAVMACNNNKTEQEAKQPADSSMHMDTMQKAAPAKDFSKLDFAYKKDLVCHMPLTAGIGDTASFKGKLYGFCSEECKKEFEKDPAGYVAKIK